MIIYTATTVGSVNGGWFSSQLIKRGWSVLRARKTVLLAFAFLELSVILIHYATNVWAVAGSDEFCRGRAPGLGDHSFPDQKL